ncbi:HlyD family secretion protein [Phyllobacterium leguminum]|uniref:Membrane fusion protein (Multidrug efflux system) n=1 Tax=Phyllobacterium leguminum TaxID=314237 RepID=A0A318T1T4_9HYPH|nr:HlyD family secretion protein [Phyllobacterium leguminum]PYE87726.1 membrane fusion protein (multidrug efflux system) [Phyllobacterium leguminum]
MSTSVSASKPAESGVNETGKVRPFPVMRQDVEGPAPLDPRAEQPAPHSPAASPKIGAGDGKAAEGRKKKGIGRRVVLPVLLAGGIVGAGWYGYDYWTNGRFLVTTDDAYVQGDIADISPKVTGYIEKVPVAANQFVKAGDVIFQLDDGDYRIALEEAEAKIATQAQTLSRIIAQIKAAQASLQQAQATKLATSAIATNAKATMERSQQLHNTRFVSQSDLDSATSALNQADANVAGADAQIAAAEANVGVLQAQYKEAESGMKSLELARDKAERDLSFATIRAPFDGAIGNLSGKLGDLVSAGQRIAALVPVDHLYIDANFKETQLAEIKPGEKVEISVDALDGETFEGTVASVAPASGAVFSLLPPENATGNFTKVVQRVPVRISIPQDALATGKFRAGLSAIVSIDTRTAPAENTVAAVVK